MSFPIKPILSGVFVLAIAIFSLLQWHVPNSLCATNGIEHARCIANLSLTWLVSLFVILLLVPFAAIFPFGEAVFAKWKRYAIWAIPITATFTYLIATMPTEGYIDIRPVLYLVVLYSLYFLISLVVIITAAIRSRKHGA